MNTNLSSRKNSAMDSGAARFLAIVKAIESLLFVCSIPVLISTVINMFSSGVFSGLYGFQDHFSAALVIAMALMLLFMAVLEILEGIGLVMGAFKRASGLKLTRGALSVLRVANIVLTALFEMLVIMLMTSTRYFDMRGFLSLQIAVAIQILRICYISRLRDMADGAKYELMGEAPTYYPKRSLSVLAIILGCLNLLTFVMSYPLQDYLTSNSSADFNLTVFSVYPFFNLFTYLSAAKYITVAMANKTLGIHCEQKSLCLKNGAEYVPVYKSLLCVLGAVGFGYYSAYSLNIVVAYINYGNFGEAAVFMQLLDSIMAALGYALLCLACATQEREALTIAGAITLSARYVLNIVCLYITYGDKLWERNTLVLISSTLLLIWLIYAMICAFVARSRRHMPSPLSLGMRVPLIALAPLPFICNIADTIGGIISIYDSPAFSYYISTYIVGIITNIILIMAHVILSCILGKGQAQPKRFSPSEVAAEDAFPQNRY